jgi:hypothetical protein
MSTAAKPKEPRRILKFRHSPAAATDTGVKTVFFLLFCGMSAVFLWTPSRTLWQALGRYKILAAAEVPDAALIDQTQPEPAAPPALEAASPSDETASIAPPAPAATISAAKKEVTLTLLAPAARQVFVGGSFNNFNATLTPMSRRKDGVWEAKLTLAPGQYLYKFKVDGEWQLDPTNNHKISEPRSASLLDLP